MAHLFSRLAKKADYHENSFKLATHGRNDRRAFPLIPIGSSPTCLYPGRLGISSILYMHPLISLVVPRSLNTIGEQHFHTRTYRCETETPCKSSGLKVKALSPRMCGDVQRHEEPKQATDEYEIGTYVYFDFNIVHDGTQSGWCYRLKQVRSSMTRYNARHAARASPL